MSWVGLGVLASSLPATLTACSEQTTSTSPEPPADPTPEPTPLVKTPDAEGFIPVGDLATLDQEGVIEDKKFPGGSLMVIRNPQDNTALIALNSLCTHQGCTVDWDQETTTLVCPCHASVFEADGSVKTGPATTALKTFSVKIDGETILVKA